MTVGAALVLAALVAGFNIALRASLDHDANNVVTARAVAALSGVEIDRGLVKGETPDQGAIDALVWVYSGQRAIERPPAPQPLQNAADSLTVGPRRSVENPQYDVRLASRADHAGRQAGRHCRRRALAGPVRADGVRGRSSRRSSSASSPSS